MLSTVPLRCPESRASLPGCGTPSVPEHTVTFPEAESQGQRYRRRAQTPRLGKDFKEDLISRTTG